MYGILVDTTRCTGCEECVTACRSVHGQAGDQPELEPSGEGLSGDQLLSIEPLEDGGFARKSCMHCLEPSCVAACLVGGITKSAEGPIVYDSSKCIGCRYCMLACPHHIPRYEWSERVPYMKKCDMCAERLALGEQPACVEACTKEVLQFGEREDLLRVAHERIAAEPERYISRVWGEHEWGGTSVLYISDVDLSVLDWPDASAPAIPALTDPMIEKMPFIGAGVAASLFALTAFFGRRNRVAALEQSSKEKKESHD